MCSMDTVCISNLYEDNSFMFFNQILHPLRLKLFTFIQHEANRGIARYTAGTQLFVGTSDCIAMFKITCLHSMNKLCTRM